MLQTINDKAKGILGWVIIAFISVPFALWGIQEYIGGGPQPFAAKVNDIEITPAEFDQAVERQRQQLASMFGGQLPSNPEFDKSIKQQVINQLINRKLLEDYTEKAGFNISNKLLAQNIQKMKVFQDDGHFDAKSYKKIVNSQGMSVGQFEYVFKQDLKVQQVQDGISKTAFVSPAEVNLVDRIQNQLRDVSYVVFEQSTYKDKVKVTEDEIAQYYEENKQNYLSPETTSIAYIELNADNIKPESEINEDELRRQYDEYVAGIAADEERKARHILVQLKDSDDEATQQQKKQKIEAARQRIAKGESFAKVAKSVSEDPGSASQGGELGWIGRGMMVPAFEESLFKLKKGELSGVIQTEFGYHIIQLEDIKGKKPESFEQKRAELVKAQQQQEIDNLFYERSELMATTAYENDDSLEPVAEALSESIKHSKSFSRTAGSGIASNEKVRQAAFSDLLLKEGRNSDVIELGKNHIVVLRTEQHHPAKPLALAEVKEQVKQALINKKIQQLAQADSQALIAELQKSASLPALAKAKKLPLKQLGFINRKFADADRLVVNEAFSMAKPSDKPVYKTVALARGLALVAVNGVKDADKLDAAETRQLQQQMEADLSGRELMAFIGQLREQADIIIADKLYDE